VPTVPPPDDLRSWIDDVRNTLSAQGWQRLGESVPRVVTRALTPATSGDEDGTAGDHELPDSFLEFDFSAWPLGARLQLEHHLAERNMEHVWRASHLLVPERLGETVDELLDEILVGRSDEPGAVGSDTRWCSSCEGEFVASVVTCPDCGVPLGDRPPSSPPGTDMATAEFDLAPWDEEARLALANQLAGGWEVFSRHLAISGTTIFTATFRRPLSSGMPHAWDGTKLVVPASEADAVASWIQAIEGSVVLALDPDADKLAYDVEDMSDESLTLLLESLLTASIPHELTADGELFVHESDEEQVEGILDRIDFPDELPAQHDAELDDPDDGLEVQGTLSDVFEAADRLSHDTHNADALLALVEGVDRLAALGVPFGFHRDQWQALVDQATELRAAIEVDEPDSEAVAEQAQALRATLHPLV
jgi:hypothetical protein